MSVDQEQRAGALWQVLVDAAKSPGPLTYKQAGQLIGIHHRVVRYPLGLIQTYCLANDLPPLTVLVVNASSGIPSSGFASDATDAGLGQSVRDFPWAQVPNPFSTFARQQLDEWAQTLLENPGSAEEVWRLVKSRGDAQRVFRRSLMQAYERACCICGLSFEEALDAAHIVGWSQYPAHRIDPRNGILLCTNHHRLFDAGWFSIGTGYEVSYSGDPDDGWHSSTDIAHMSQYHGVRIRLPKAKKLWPSKALLMERSGS